MKKLILWVGLCMLAAPAGAEDKRSGTQAGPGKGGVVLMPEAEYEKMPKYIVSPSGAIVPHDPSASDAESVLKPQTQPRSTIIYQKP